MRCLFGSVLLLVGLTLTGCGSKADLSTPSGTVAAFQQAMENAQFDEAAHLFAFATSAEKKNPDWPEFSEGQRKLIIGELAKARAKELQGAAQKFLGAEYTLGAESISGETATVELMSAAGKKSVVKLVKEQDAWRLQRVPGL